MMVVLLGLISDYVPSLGVVLETKCGTLLKSTSSLILRTSECPVNGLECLKETFWRSLHFGLVTNTLSVTRDPGYILVQCLIELIL